MVLCSYTQLSHYVFFVMKERITEAANIFSFKFYIEGIHHELTLTFSAAAHHAFGGTGLIATAGAIFRALDHWHFAVDGDRFWTFAGIGGLADIGVRDRHYGVAHRCFTHVGENGA